MHWEAQGELYRSPLRGSFIQFLGKSIYIGPHILIDFFRRLLFGVTAFRLCIGAIGAIGAMQRLCAAHFEVGGSCRPHNGCLRVAASVG